MIRHEGGAGHVEDRMEAPHPHWTGFSPDGRFAFVPDLGMNAVVVYSVVDGPSYIEEKAVVSSIYGGGPRHMRFSVDGKFVYLLNELTLSVTTFAYEPELGGLTQLTTTPALSEEVKRCETFNSGSEILVHPNGRFVYSGNRGHDSVTAFEVGQETGELHVVDVEPIRGSWPRHINLDPSGRWLLAAGARSNTVSVFSADPTTGHLQFPEWSVYSLPACICILFQN